LGWREALILPPSAATVIILPAGLLLRRAPQALAEATPQTGVDVEPRKPQPTSAFSALRTPQFAILAGTFFLCCAAHSGPIFHTVSYAMLCGIPALAAASIYSVEGLAGLFGRVIFGVAADRLGVKKVIIAGLAVQAIGIYLYIYVSELTGFYSLAVMLGLAYGGGMPLYAVLARDYFGPHVMGTVLGGATMVSSIGMAFGPVGGGWLYDNFGSYHWLYMASAAVGVAAAAMALAFPPPKGDAETPQGLAQAI
jgi:MFS family permease